MRVDNAKSVDVGSVRLFERHIRSNPPTPAEMSAVTTFVADQLLTDPAPSGPAPRGHGGDGDHDRSHRAGGRALRSGPYPGLCLTRDEIAAVGSRLCFHDAK